MTTDKTKQFILTAKAAPKFVPAVKKIQSIQKSVKKAQAHLTRVNKSLSQIGSNRSSSPKLKKMRLNKAKALQNYLKSAILLDQARIKNLQKPE